LETSFSDHYPVLTILDMPICSSAKLVSKIDTLEINRYLSKLEWSETGIYTCHSAIEVSNIFCNAIGTAILLNTSYVVDRGRKDCRRVPLKPWITDNLIKCMRKRDRLVKCSNKNPFDLNLRTRSTAYKKILKTILTDAKKLYFNRYFSANASDSKRVWK